MDLAKQAEEIASILGKWGFMVPVIGEDYDKAFAKVLVFMRWTDATLTGIGIKPETAPGTPAAMKAREEKNESPRLTDAFAK